MIDMSFWDDKKGSIAATITWVVAFVIIFFIIFLFFAGVVMLSKSKSFSFKTDVLGGNFETERVVQRDFLGILSTPIGEDCPWVKSAREGNSYDINKEALEGLDFDKINYKQLLPKFLVGKPFKYIDPITRCDVYPQDYSDCLDRVKTLYDKFALPVFDSDGKRIAYYDDYLKIWARCLDIAAIHYDWNNIEESTYDVPAIETREQYVAYLEKQRLIAERHGWGEVINYPIVTRVNPGGLGNFVNEQEVAPGAAKPIGFLVPWGVSSTGEKLNAYVRIENYRYPQVFFESVR